MSTNNGPKIATAVFAGLGAVVAGISCAISGISASKVQPSDKDTLLAASALTGFGTIILIVAMFILFAYMKNGKTQRGLKIAFIVMGIAYGLMIMIGGILSGVVGSKPANAAHKDALIASAVMPVFSMIFFIIAAIISGRVKGYGINFTGNNGVRLTYKGIYPQNKQ